MHSGALNDGPLEERIGRLLIRRPRVGRGAYRQATGASLELVREKAPESSPRSRLVFALVLILSGLLLGFALYARSAPAIGTVTMAFVAMLCLVLVRRAGARAAALRIDADQRVVARCADGTTFAGPLTQIDDVGIGVDMQARRTVWIKVGSERRLLFDGLTDVEAVAAREALFEAAEAARARGRGRPAIEAP